MCGCVWVSGVCVWACVCVCVGCVGVGVWACVRACVCAGVWRAGVGIIMKFIIVSKKSNNNSIL